MIFVPYAFAFTVNSMIFSQFLIFYAIKTTVLITDSIQFKLTIIVFNGQSIDFIINQYLLGAISIEFETQITEFATNRLAP